MLAAGALRWRLCAVIDETADSALPVDRLIPLVERAILEHRKKPLVSVPVVLLDLRYLPKEIGGRHVAFLLRQFAIPVSEINGCRILHYFL